MSEKAVESSTCAWLAFQGYIPLKVGLEGWPDRCVILGQNRHLWLEFKAPDGKLRPQQTNRIQSLKEIGEVVYVVTSLEEVQGIIASLQLPSPLSTHSNRKAGQKETASAAPETWAWQDRYNPNRPKGNK